MEQAMFYAPQVRAILKHYSDRYEGCKDITAETVKKIDELFHEMDRIPERTSSIS